MTIILLNLVWESMWECVTELLLLSVAFHDLLEALECVPARRDWGLAGSGECHRTHCLAENAVAAWGSEFSPIGLELQRSSEILTICWGHGCEQRNETCTKSSDVRTLTQWVKTLGHLDSELEIVICCYCYCYVLVIMIITNYYEFLSSSFINCISIFHYLKRSNVS